VQVNHPYHVCTSSLIHGASTQLSTSSDCQWLNLLTLEDVKKNYINNYQQDSQGKKHPKRSSSTPIANVPLALPHLGLEIALLHM
jgi:hypothetical protein